MSRLRIFMSIRQKLWGHRPLTDFWRVGKGYAQKLEAAGLYTMGDIARCSLQSAGEDFLYQMFGVNAELLIDHAWGWEPCTIADIKAYKPESNSIGSGQVLQEPYPYEKAKLMVDEMAHALAFELFVKRLVSKQITMTVGYDIENKDYRGEISIDRYGRRVPKHAHGTERLEQTTSSEKLIRQAAQKLFDRIINKSLTVRRIYITAENVINESEAEFPTAEQIDLFTNYDAEQRKKKEERAELEKEKRTAGSVPYQKQIWEERYLKRNEP